MKNRKRIRSVFFYKDYFNTFFKEQRKNVKKKIIWTLEVIQELDKIPEIYLKHIANAKGLYELRIQQGTDIFRVFCFFDDENLIVLANGFHKKTQKTPVSEIEKALRIKKEYENEKE